MKITKLKVENFRLLRSFELDLEHELSLIIGKNNCGKTSLLSLLEKFIGAKSSSNTFTLDDFNIEFQKEMQIRIESMEQRPYSYLGISLKLFIQYNDKDDLSNVSKLMLDLDPANKTIVLKFEYSLLEEDFKKLKVDYQEYKHIIDNKYSKLNLDISDIPSLHKKTLNDFLKINHKKYFKLLKKSIGYNVHTDTEVDTEYIDLMKSKISIDKVLNFKMISAKRNVSNIDSDRTLSALSAKYYSKKEEKGSNTIKIQEFKEALSSTDIHLNEIYSGLFESVIEKVKTFGGVRKGDSVIKIESTLQHQELLKDNTTVMYSHNEGHSLPENYNGLGYLNLISMIFEIELLLSDFRMENNVNETPADINLLFIEEPEAHTHPQMQYIFIKNVKDILNRSSNGEDGRAFNLQTIITTHSCHITSESNFDDIKYFYKTDENHVIAKNLKDLEKEYEDDKEINNFKFLKQYLTLHRSELFFVDKAIFIEGDTERILLPEMMKKIDLEFPENPLQSQNISIVEVGAYSHIFEKFIDFIGVKSLIITDIDSAKKIEEKNKKGIIKKKNIKCRVSDPIASITTNAALNYFFKYYFQEFQEREAAVAKDIDNNEINNLEFFKILPLQGKLLKKQKEKKQWSQSNEGNILIIFQTPEKNSSGLVYHARSFEDAFFHVNRKYIVNNKDTFNSLVNIDNFDDDEIDAYDLAEYCIGKKPSFAMEILLSSTRVGGNIDQFSDWVIPGYIKEGLQWLKN
ncbi:ATP-dependent endonuclease [Paenibacillus sepulcri]|uniref:ATP-dependent endonuclease n=1 Tax=Paenibacillus sepulcri TaxID=359917 RepID=A0ABS7C2I3_9BACL|nr:ATP-dependent endonuclease [Paenibacillus sepulcri]